MLPAWFRRSITSKTLALTALLSLALTLATRQLVLAVAGAELEAQAREGLSNWLQERLARERATFRLALDNTALLARLFSGPEAEPRSDEQVAAEFARRYQRLPDGTIRNRREGYDGTTAVQVFLGRPRPGKAPESGLAVQRRILKAAGILATIGPASHARHQDTYYTFSDNSIAIYWPEAPTYAFDFRSDYDLRVEEYFARGTPAEAPSRQPTWTGTYFDPVASRWMTSVVQPIDDAQGHHLGNVSHDLLLEEFLARTLSSSIEGATNLVIRSDGRLIAHPALMDDLKRLKGDYQVSVHGDQHLRTIFAAAQDRETKVIDLDGYDEYAAIGYLPETDWHFVTVLPKDLVLGGLRRLARLVTLVGVGLLAVQLLALSWLLRRTVLGPLHRLSEAAAAITAGGDRRLRMNRLDELGQLADRFDEMLGSISERDQALRSHALSLEETVAERTKELEAAVRTANAANAAKSLFLGSMSHELRTPLNVILGYAQILQRNASLGPGDAQAADRILQAGTHLLGLIEDVLSISRADAGTLRLRSAPLSPRELLATLEAMFTPMARSKGLALTLERAPEVPDYLQGDAGKLRQVLVNLIGNAIKFTAKGAVRVSLRMQDEELWCSVSDTGPGIEKVDADKLFGTFFQGAHGRAAAEGTGLGLFISRSLVELMGGKLSFETQVGRGSTFTFSAVAPPALPPGEERRAARAPRLPAGRSVAPMLVVDDRHTNREMLQRTLEEMGFVVAEAKDGAEGLARIQRERFSLVWMDLRMPVLDGAEAVQRLRVWERETGAARTPVVAITASVVELEPEEARRQGFDRLLGKPFRQESIVAAVEALLGLSLEDATPADTGPAGVPAALDERSLQTLPAALRARLLTGLVAGDTAAAVEALAPLGEAPLAAALRARIEGYDFEGLLASLRATMQG